MAVLLKRKIKMLNGLILSEKISNCTYKCSNSTSYFHEFEVNCNKNNICAEQYKISEETAEKIIKEYNNDNR